MNRRGFLQWSAAVSAGVFLPPVSGITNADIKCALDIVSLTAGKALDGEWYFVFLHPRQFQDLRDLQAREWWKQKWRRQRLAKKGIVVQEEPMPEIGGYRGVEFASQT